jgi:hypothetical protein
MSDATKLPAEQQTQAMADISAEGLPLAIERQAAAGVAEADSIVVMVDGQAGLQVRGQLCRPLACWPGASGAGGGGGGAAARPVAVAVHLGLQHGTG